jgi:putative membrane protein
MMIRFLLKALVSAGGLWLASKIVHGIHVSDLGTLIAAAILLGVVNAIVRPILIVLTLPLTLVTFGLFLLVVNAAMLGLVSLFLHGFRLDGIVPAVLGAIVLGVVSWVASGVIDGPGYDRRMRMRVGGRVERIDRP